MTNGSPKTNGSSQCQLSKTPEARSAVAWISGHDAVNMEQASEQDFQQEIAEMMDSFPALDLPRSFKVSKLLELS